MKENKIFMMKIKTKDTFQSKQQEKQNVNIQQHIDKLKNKIDLNDNAKFYCSIKVGIEKVCDDIKQFTKYNEIEKS